MRQKIRTMNFFEGHVSSLCFIKDLPFFTACSEDGKLVLVSTKTYEIAAEFEHLMGRAWHVKCRSGKLAVGYDKGCMVLQIGSETPLFSFQKGKLLLCKSSTIQSTNLKALVTKGLKDMEKVSIDCKELARTDLFPKQLLHSPNGQFFAVFDGAEYAIHKSTSGKQVCFGTCRGLVWGAGNQLCVLQGDSTMKVLTASGEEIDQLQVDFYIKQIFGGRFLAAAALDFAVFYDLDELTSVGKIDAAVVQIVWPPKQQQFAVSTLDGFYLLEYQNEAGSDSLSDMSFDEDCFTVVADSEDRFSSGLWLEGVFVFLKDRTRLSLVGLGEVVLLTALPYKSHLVGYLPNQGKLYCLSAKGELFTFSLNRSLLKTICKLNKIYAKFPEPENPEDSTPAISNNQRSLLRNSLKTFRSQKNEDSDFLARIFRLKKFNELAFEVAKDQALRFEIALDRGALAEAFTICAGLASTLKWKRLGDEAMLKGNFIIAKRAFVKASDLNALLMLGSSLGDTRLVRFVGCKGLRTRHYSVSFCAFWILRDLKMCHATLIHSERYALNFDYANIFF